MTKPANPPPPPPLVPPWLLSIAVGVAVLAMVTLIVLPTAQVADQLRGSGLGWSYAFVLVWRDLQQWLARLDWMMVFGAILIVGTIVILTKMSRSETGAFDFADAFAGENGHTSMAKLTAWIGSLTASWIMVALAVSGKMTETYMATYLGILVIGKVGTEAVGVLRQSQIARTVEARGGGPEPPPQQVGSVQMDVPLMAQGGAAQANTVVSRPLGKRQS